MENLVDTVVEQLGDRRVTTVRLEIGELSGVAIDALRFGFDVCVQGTSLEGAALDIVSIPGAARCRRCEREYALLSYAQSCTCGSFDRELLSGDELRLKEVEVL